MRKPKILLRVLVSPFVLGIILVSYIYHAFVKCTLFIKYGGEFVNYDKDEIITIKMIYDEIKKDKSINK